MQGARTLTQTLLPSGEILIQASGDVARIGAREFRAPRAPRKRRKRRMCTKEEETQTCIMCLAELGHTQITVMPCAHIIHSACVDPWLDMNETCPTCRAPTTPT